MKEPICLGSWQSPEDIAQDWPRAEKILVDACVHFAYYNAHDYLGTALIVFTKGGKLYELNGAHCSCHGLGGWDGEVDNSEPEETSWQALARRKLGPYKDDPGERAASEQLQALARRYLDENEF